MRQVERKQLPMRLHIRFSSRQCLLLYLCITWHRPTNIFFPFYFQYLLKRLHKGKYQSSIFLRWGTQAPLEHTWVPVLLWIQYPGLLVRLSFRTCSIRPLGHLGSLYNNLLAYPSSTQLLS